MDFTSSPLVFAVFIAEISSASASCRSHGFRRGVREGRGATTLALLVGERRAAVLGIVRGHSGAIEVSTRPGNGTAFRVLFPAGMAAPERAIAAKPAGADNADHDGAGKCLVLLIDDEEVVRAMAKRTLEQHGYSVLLADNGEAGVRMFRENADRIGCLVLDLFMPVMAGEETLKQVQQLRADVPVILSSGCSEAEVIRRFEGKRLAGFIQKPYKAAALASKIREVLAMPSRTWRVAEPAHASKASDNNH